MSEPKPIRVLVVEDSLTVRRYLGGVFASDPSFEVVGEATDGKQAIALCSTLRPDVVTMDMLLPVMTGLAATEYIMAHCPTPILVVSSSANRGELFKTYDALAAGAVDVLEKPTGDEADGEWEAKLLASTRLVSRIRVITHMRGLGASPPPSGIRPAPPLRARRGVDAVLIGASTGGPAAIVQVLRSLPATFETPVLVVLHIGEEFGGAVADWLDGQTPRPVVTAEEGARVADQVGRVVIAPAGKHLVVERGRLRLTSDPEVFSCRPSVDRLFDSAARDLGSLIACLLTGMGRDGAAGLLEIRRRGGVTIAQDEASCVIFGMPREAILLGAAEHVLPLDEIGPALGELAKKGGTKP